MDRRLQVLIDDARYRRLERIADERGVSVARVVREAIDLLAPSADLDRPRAARLLLDAEPMPIDDWPTLKEEIEGRFDGACG